MYHVFKISSVLCFGYVAYCAFVNNMQMATYMFLCGFYADWLAEKEKRDE